MREARISVRRDELNNVIGRYEGKNLFAPILLVGSHIDSVGAANPAKRDCVNPAKGRITKGDADLTIINLKMSIE
jgi:acetylornithine deacetylase/succinyl-diaminopimelate desuccinylase-like protein